MNIIRILDLMGLHHAAWRESAGAIDQSAPVAIPPPATSIAIFASGEIITELTRSPVTELRRLLPEQHPRVEQVEGCNLEVHPRSERQERLHLSRLKGQ